MAETEMYTGVVTALLNKYADPILKGVTGFAKDGWEKFKVPPEKRMFSFIS